MAKGVMFMYISFVFVIGKVIRQSCISNRMLMIPYDEMPEVDYLMSLIDNMKMAREFDEPLLEEQLYAKLIFILRCPDILFYVSRIRDIWPIKDYYERNPPPSYPGSFPGSYPGSFPEFLERPEYPDQEQTSIPQWKMLKLSYFNKNKKN